MPVGRPTHNLKNNLPKSSIWISDDILNQVLHSYLYLRSTRRHVSSVPGPLEARKRATKRRMVNVSPAATHSDVELPFWGRFGQAAERQKWQWQWQWQEPKSTPELSSKLGDDHGITADSGSNDVVLSSAEKKPCSTWLFDFDRKEDSQPQNNSHKEPNTDTPHSLQQEDQVLNTEQQFLLRMKDCASLENIHSVADELKINFHEAPHYSKLVFKQLLALRPYGRIIFDFLADPSLNPTKAKNFSLLLRSITALNIRHFDAVALKSWSAQQIRHSLFSEKDVRLLLNRLNIFCQYRRHEVQDWWVTILEAIDSSSTLHLKSMDVETLRLFLLTLYRQPSKTRAAPADFIIHNIQYGKKRSAQLFLYVEKIIFQLLMSHVKEEKLRWNLPFTINVAREFLQGFSERSAVQVVSQISMDLLETSQLHPESNSNRIKSVLRSWWRMVTTSGFLENFRRSDAWYKIEKSLAIQEDWLLGSYLSDIDGAQICIFLIKHWYSHRFVSESQPFITQSILSYFEKLQVDDGSLPFINMLQAVWAYSEPQAQETKRLFSLMRHFYRHEEICHIISFFANRPPCIHSSVVASEIQQCVRIGPYKAAAEIYSSYPWVFLERCPTFVDSIISDARIGPSAAIDIWKRQQGSMKPEFWIRQSQDLKEPTLREKRQLLERMALNYAHVIHKPLVAFQMVYRCFLNQHVERLGPLHPPMTKALIQSGIIRPLEVGQWVSESKVNWILSIVAKVEGEDVADKVSEIVWRWRAKLLERRRMEFEELRNKSSQDRAILPPDH
ncbi:MAG: hypothetical protein Q9167_005187 [Letrouitia subvulpina]